MANKQFSKSALVLVAICLVFAVVLFALNIPLAPIIEKNSSAQASASLFKVMPEAKGFEPIEIADAPTTVTAVYAETSGLGYAVNLSTTEGYTGDPMELTMAVTTDGKITGIEVNTYPDSKDFGAEYPLTYIGQDSALADVSLVAGVTFSSSAFKNAVSDGLEYLIANGLISEGVKGDDQILMEMAAQLVPGMATPAGMLQYEEAEASGTYIVKAMKALNGSVAACIVQDGDNTYLAACNLSGSCHVFDVNGDDVTDSVNAAIVSEVSDYAGANLSSFQDAELKKLSKQFGDGAEFTAISLDGVFNSVTGAYKVTDGGSVSYAFVARPYGYSNELMTYYFVLDEQGAVVKMDADEIILHAEYYSSYTLDPQAYKDGMVGQTGESWNSDPALITGATFSAQATDNAARDVFAAFEAVVK